MKGTDKQIKFAQDLIEDYKERRVKKFVKAGKADKIQGRIQAIEYIETLEDAGLIITILREGISSFTKMDDPVNDPRGIKAHYYIN